MLVCSVKITIRLDSQSNFQMFTLYFGRHIGGLPRGFLMSLCRSFANPAVACLVRDKCRCRFFAVIKMSLLHKICAMQSVISIIYYCSCS